MSANAIPLQEWAEGLSTGQLVEYLLVRKYPEAAKRHFLPNLMRAGQTTYRPHSPISPDVRNAIACYHAELQSIDKGRLVASFVEQKTTEARASVEEHLKQEREAFWNRSDAQLDCAKWAKMARWRLDEAIALSFNKNPEKVNWKNVGNWTGLFRFADEYRERRECVMRAEAMSLLNDPVKPAAFLRWAEIIGIEMPTDLIECVLSIQHKLCAAIDKEGVSDRTHTSSRGAKAKSIRRAIEAVFPNGIPSTLETKERDKRLTKWLLEHDDHPVPSPRTFQRVIGEI